MRFYTRRILRQPEPGRIVEPVKVELEWDGPQRWRTSEVLHMERGRRYPAALVEGPHWLEVFIYPAGPEGASVEIEQEHSAAWELARELYQTARGDIQTMLVDLCKALVRAERQALELAAADNRHSDNGGAE